MKEIIKQQIEEVNKAAKVVEEVRQKLNEAMLERKTQETLREKAFEEFLLASLKRFTPRSALVSGFDVFVILYTSLIIIT